MRASLGCLLLLWHLAGLAGSNDNLEARRVVRGCMISSSSGSIGSGGLYGHRDTDLAGRRRRRQTLPLILTRLRGGREKSAGGDNWLVPDDGGMMDEKEMEMEMEMEMESDESSSYAKDVAAAVQYSSEESAGMISDEIANAAGALPSNQTGATVALGTNGTGSHPLFEQDEFQRGQEELAMLGEEHVQMVGLTIDVGYLREGSLEEGVDIPAETWRKHLWSCRKRAHAERMRREGRGDGRAQLLEEARACEVAARQRRSALASASRQRRDDARSAGGGEDAYDFSDSFIASESDGEEEEKKRRGSRKAGGATAHGRGSVTARNASLSQNVQKAEDDEGQGNLGSLAEALDDDAMHGRLPFKLVTGKIFSKLADNEDFALRLELRTAPRAGVGRRISRIAPLRERDYDRLVYSNNFSSFRVVNPSTYAQLSVSMTDDGVPYTSHGHALLRGADTARCLAQEMGVPLPTRGKTTWRLMKLRQQEKEPPPKEQDQQAKSQSGFVGDRAAEPVLDGPDVVMSL